MISGTSTNSGNHHGTSGNGSGRGVLTPQPPLPRGEGVAEA